MSEEGPGWGPGAEAGAWCPGMGSGNGGWGGSGDVQEDGVLRESRRRVAWGRVLELSWVCGSGAGVLVALQWGGESREAVPGQCRGPRIQGPGVLVNLGISIDLGS